MKTKKKKNRPLYKKVKAAPIADKDVEKTVKKLMKKHKKAMDDLK